jgi:hypothetical protein
MPSRADKRLRKLRDTKAGWTTKELSKVYEDFGFHIRKGTKHYIITHPDFSEIRDMLPYETGEISPDYPRDALKSINLVLAKQEQESSTQKQDENEGENE